MVIFVSKIQKCYYKIDINTLPENGVGLYPNISQHTGLSAFKEAFDSTSVKYIPAKNLNKMAEFVLKINYFEINNKVFRQISGAAKGTKFVPSYRSIQMDTVNQNLLDT